VLVGATAAGGAAAFGLIPGVPAVAELAALLKPTRHRPDAGAPQPSATTLDGGAVPKSLLDTLVGSWVGNGRELEAVLAGKDLEFRVKKPEQFPFQGYEAGEPRFILHATAEPNVFVVEDRIRPVLPPGKSYDPRARGTCQEVWTAVAGDPLRARYDAPRLSVEFAKIEPSQANFTMVGAKVTSCVALRELKASKVRSTLVRP
jgi:serine/threonine-protein kinase